MVDQETTAGAAQGAMQTATSPTVEKPDLLTRISTMVQVLSVVAGVVVSVLGLYASQQHEAESRRIEAAKPFLELRQSRYREALAQVAILANPETHSADEITAARKRFRELYVAELSMVEVPAVEAQMVALARLVDQDVTRLTPAQKAAYDLAHVLRDSLLKSYGIAQ